MDGLTVLWATTFLMFRAGAWKIFQSLIVILTVILATRMITYNNKKNKALVASIIWICLYMMTIWISREVLYWLDGGLAYEFTAFQIFVYFYYLYTRLILKINKKYDKILLPIIAFFAGWSSAQTGPMAVVIPILLIIWQKFIKKEKVSKFYYFTTILGIIGFAIFYFAPGNYGRMDSAFPDFASYNIIQKILYRVDSIYSLMFNFTSTETMGIPFYLIFFSLLNAIVGVYLVKDEKKKATRLAIKVSSAVQIAFALICLAIAFNVPYFDILSKCFITFENVVSARNEGRLRLYMFLPYIFASLVLLAIVVEAYLISLKEKNPFFVITIISAFLMQGVMVMAPYSPLRTTYYTIMFLWLAIAYLIKLSYENKINLLCVLIIPFAIYNTQLGIVATIIYLLTQNIFTGDLYKYELAMVIIIMLSVAFGNYITTKENYAINKEIYNENISRIKDFKEQYNKDSTNKELYLLQPNDEKYGFTAMTGIDWVEHDLKTYFDIDQDVILKTEVRE